MSLSRRNFLGTAAATAVTAAADTPKLPALPRRLLGSTGANVNRA